MAVQPQGCTPAPYRRRSPADSPAFIHRFGSSLNLHTHFHVCVIDGVFEPDPQGGVRFFAADELVAGDAETVQGRVRRRILRAFVRRGLIDKDDRKEMELREHGGGFSLDATVYIAANDRRGLERLLAFLDLEIRPPTLPSARFAPANSVSRPG